MKEEAVQPICPQCDSAWTEGALICLNCGFIREADDQPPAPTGGGIRALMTAIAGLALLIVLSSGYIHYEAIRVEFADKLPTALQERLQPRLNRPFYPDWMQTMTREALETVFQDQVTRELNTSHPLHREGDAITLKSKSGTAGSGILQGIEPACALIQSNGQTLRVPFTNLDTDCRLRLDVEGRAVYIYKLAQRRAAACLSGDDATTAETNRTHPFP